MRAVGSERSCCFTVRADVGNPASDRWPRRNVSSVGWRFLLATVIGLALVGSATADRRGLPRVVASFSVNSPVAIVVGAGSVWVSAGEAVVRIDPRTDRVVARIPVPGWSGGIAVADGVVWVARNPVDTTGVARPGWLWSINTATNRVFGKPVRLALPTQIAASAGSLWVTNGNHGIYGRVFRVDPVRRLIVATVKVPGGPEGIVAEGGSLWVAASDSGNLVRIDPRTDAVVGPALHVRGALVTITAIGDRLWVGDNYSGAVLQVNPTTPTNAFVTRTPLSGVTDIAADGTGVWATTAGPSQLVELDPRTGATAGRPIPMPAGAFRLALGFSSIWVITAHAVIRIQT